MSEVKCVMWDLDGTLFEETLLDDAETILSCLKSLGINQSLLTLNPYAQFYCQRYGLNQYFDKICSGPVDDHKLAYTKEILDFYRSIGILLKEEECLFIDDDPENIKTISNQTKIKCLQVSSGIKRAQIQAYVCHEFTGSFKSSGWLE
mgnify:CR=1 FL=1